MAATHRPRSFATLTGQRHVVAVLRRAIGDDRVPQQLLFSGGSGLGKTTVARILATALLCTTEMSGRNDGDACGSCTSCVAVSEDRHPDLIEFDAASNGGKDEIREIAARAQITPLLSKRRVYIIDEAHGLSAPGGQAFLKLLEEPPGHVIFMLCTTDPQRMLKTNRGRCTEFELLPPTRKELISNLKRICDAEDWRCEEDILEMVVDSTDPDLGVRGTVNMLSKLTSVLDPLNSPGLDEASLLLGRASDDLTRSLFSAITQGDAAAASESLLRLREKSSEEAIRKTLLDLSRARLTSELRNGISPNTYSTFEQLVTLPKGRQWLDLYVYRVCALHLVQPANHITIPKSASAVEAPTSNQIAELASTISTIPPTTQNKPASQTAAQAETLNTADVSTPTNPTVAAVTIAELDPTPITKSIPVSTKAATSTPSGQSKQTRQRESKPGLNRSPSNQGTSQAEIVQEAPGNEGEQSLDLDRGTSLNRGASQTFAPLEHAPKALTGSPVAVIASETATPQTKHANSSGTQMSPVQGFVTAVGKIDPDLAGALRRCTITISDSVSVEYGNTLRIDIEGGQKVLRQVAGRAGLALQLLLRSEE